MKRLNLIENAEGKWYFAGIGVPPQLAMCNADGKPGSAADVMRVNEHQGYAGAKMHTRHFDNLTSAVLEATLLGYGLKITRHQ